MAYAVIISREAKVEADAFRMPDMQVAIRLGGETGFHASSPFSAPVILFNYIADEVGSSSGAGAGSTLSVKWASQISNPVIIVRMTRYLR